MPAAGCGPPVAGYGPRVAGRTRRTVSSGVRRRGRCDREPGAWHPLYANPASRSHTTCRHRTVAAAFRHGRCRTAKSQPELCPEYRLRNGVSMSYHADDHIGARIADCRELRQLTQSGLARRAFVWWPRHSASPRPHSSPRWTPPWRPQPGSWRWWTPPSTRCTSAARATRRARAVREPPATMPARPGGSRSRTRRARHPEPGRAGPHVRPPVRLRTRRQAPRQVRRRANPWVCRRTGQGRRRSSRARSRSPS